MATEIINAPIDENVRSFIEQLFPDATVSFGKEDVVFILTENGIPIGFVHVSQFKGYGVIRGIGVIEKYRGLGHGNQLMAKGLNHLYFERNVPIVILKVRKDNRSAIMFYKDKGFKIVKANTNTLIMARWLC